MSTDNSTNNVWDTVTEYGFRKWHTYLQSQLVAAGFVQTADTGQLSLSTAYAWFVRGDGSQMLSGGVFSNLFDGSTSTNWAPAVAPGVGASSINVVFDLGAGNSNTAATYKVYMQGISGDPATWTLQGSPDGTTWTTLDTQTAISVTVGYQTYTIASPAAYRFHRMVITASRGAVALQMMDLQLLTSAPANFFTYTPLAPLGTALDTLIGYEVYRFADALQSTYPVFFRVEYWNEGATIGIGGCGMWITFSNATDGAGNMVGVGTSTRSLVRGGSVNAGNLTSPTVRHVACGAGGKRFGCALGYGTAAGCWFAFERIKDASGADTNLGVAIFASGAGTAAPLSVVMAGAGAAPGVDASVNALMPSATTGSGAGIISLYELVPMLGPRQPSFLSALMYFNANISAETPVTVTMYGGSHTYFPVGNGLSNITVRSVGGASVALLYE